MEQQVAGILGKRENMGKAQRLETVDLSWGQWVVMQNNLWEVHRWKGWKGGRGGRGWYGKPGGDGEAWDVDGWGMVSWNGNSYMVEVFLEQSLSRVQSPPLAQHILPIHSTTSMTSLQGLQVVWVGLSSKPGPYFLDSVVSVWELCWSGLIFWAIISDIF